MIIPVFGNSREKLIFVTKLGGRVGFDAGLYYHFGLSFCILVLIEDSGDRS